ncbi:fatty acid synthase-like [Zophobas morio]|uniref:fatty acid synthase-like n=1 Tax=Zophobas morio TaxID=2755281 RepID=UPI0030839F66
MQFYGYDGLCKVFDENANGYVRSEACACLFLQKAKNTNRIYAKVINVKGNNDGFKDEGITYPSSEMQEKLIAEIYRESNISPSSLSYIEAHCTGTRVGDPEEVRAIDEALAKNREQQLLIGSVKSNTGHTEPPSALCSIIKVVIALETGFIPPNINLETIRRGLEGIEQNRMKVVTDTTELLEDDAIVGVNNFGFGGSNIHVILQRFNKLKIDGGLPKDDVPRLICVSGRTKEAVLKILNYVSSKSLDAEYVGLLNQLYKKNISNHSYRGYAIVSKRGVLSISSKRLPIKQPRLHIFFGQFVKNFKLLGSYLLQFLAFRNVISRVNKILVVNKIKTLEEIFKSKINTNEDILGSICLQLIMVDIFKVLGLFPRSVSGATFGKIVYAYSNDIMQMEEAVMGAIKLSKPKFDSDTNKSENFVDSKTEQLVNHGDISYETSHNIPKGTIIINISDFPITNKDNLLFENGTVNFLNVVGRLYMEGYLPQVHKIFPKIEFPVSRSTSIISPSIQWNHSTSWDTFKFEEFAPKGAEQMDYDISYFYEECQFLNGHVIDGRNIFPATEYVKLVWETFSNSKTLTTNITPVKFENCKFLRALTMPNTGYLLLHVMLQKGTGNFEILHNDSLLASGRITSCSHSDKQEVNLSSSGVREDDKLKILTQEEIYREFHLRGYNYSGLFKAIKAFNVDASLGLIKWDDNWSTFMDNMLQLQLLQTDTRLLYVPTGIKKIIIDPIKHKHVVESQNEQECFLPAYVSKNSNMIMSGGIEIHGIRVKSAFRKKGRLEPVLEKHVFVPNNTTLELEEVVRVNTQIILENTLEYHFKAVEIINEFTDINSEHILCFVNKALADIPVVAPDLTVSSKAAINDTPGIKYETITLTPESNILLYIGSKILQQSITLKQFFVPLSENGFVLTLEEISFRPEKCIDGVEILTDYSTPNERIILFRKKVTTVKPKCIEVSSTNFEWLPELQNSLSQRNNVITYATNQQPEGILGLINCIRREKDGNLVKCFFMMDDAPGFDFQHWFYAEQISKNLATNIFKNGSWGTYRHLRLEEIPKINSEHSYAYFKHRGNMSSFEWLEGPLNREVPLPEGQILGLTYYSPVNFKDIMAASGRVNPEILQPHRLAQEVLTGFEFSGKDLRGRRIAGITNSQGISSDVSVDSSTIWQVPNAWTLEDAATVSAVYITVLYALLLVGNMRPGCSILIHCATGGIGLAALNVCLHYKCDIYATVGSEKKRAYLNKHYPQIPNNHIGNSRDTSFEQMIKRETESRGVDFVLNSLSEDKLQASIKCLARKGQLMELGKYDLANDSYLNLLLMEKEAIYHGIVLDAFFRNSVIETKSKLTECLLEGIKAGFVKPLPRVCFNANQVEESYKYMMSGQHIGRILVKLRNEEDIDNDDTGIEKFQISSKPRFNCDVRYTYIIVGGLGGIGLELADWLVLRGARKLVLTSRSGLQSGYHQQRINIWKSYGVQVKVCTNDVTTEQKCEDLVKEANELGEIDAIFNLAVVLQDALFQDQTKENFLASFTPKAHATVFLDKVSRKLCPNLRYFVVFSSVSCGLGNAGQSNYGMANSVMERICENRKREGLPAVAIQWGAVGDVGLVAKMQKEHKELVIGGTLQQKISSCFEVLDVLLKHNYPVVSSMVVAEKHHKGDILSAVDAIAHIIGIKDIKTVSPYATFAELGMDSMMGTEIIQLLENDFEIYVTPKDIRSLTFAKLAEIEAEKLTKNEIFKKIQQGINLLIHFISDIESSDLPVVQLTSQVQSSEEAPTVFVLPGVEGAFKPLEVSTSSLKAHVVGIRYNNKHPENSVEQIAKNIISHIECRLAKNISFFVIGYSFGTTVALELVSLLENRGIFGTVILIDGSPTYLSSGLRKNIGGEETELQMAILYKVFSIVIPYDVLSEHQGALLKAKDLEQRIDVALDLIPQETTNKQKLDKQDKQIPVALYKRLKAIMNYTFGETKIKSLVPLFKAKYSMVDDDDDYQLSKVSENLAQVVTINGDHVTILNNPDLVKSINNIVTL